MTLGNLVGRTLESVEPDASAIARLLDAAKSSLADAKLPGISNEALRHGLQGDHAVRECSIAGQWFPHANEQTGGIIRP